MNTTILIDGNWLMMSRLFAVKEYFKIENDNSEKEKGTKELEILMSKSINIIINKLEGIVDNIILVRDGGSWRKYIASPSFIEEEYKGNRVKSAELDWTYIYKSLDYLAESSSKQNITVCKAKNIEGDDWIYHWSRKLNKMGINCIIWSSDADLKQLVQVNNFAFTAWLNESQKGGLPGLILHKDLDNTSIDLADIFMQPENRNSTLDNLCAKVKAVTYIDPSYIIEEKIICGDKGDNIKSLIRQEKNGRTQKISKNDWLKIKSELNIASLDDFFNKKHEIVTKLSSLSKFKANKLTHSARALEMFDFNKELVWLNETVIPEKILSEMHEVEYKKCDMEFIKRNYKTLISENTSETDIEDIFSNVSFSENDLF